MQSLLAFPWEMHKRPGFAPHASMSTTARPNFSTPAMKETAVTNKSRIMVYGPNPDDTYVIEFRTADGQTLAISMPPGEWLCSSLACRHIP